MSTFTVVWCLEFFVATYGEFAVNIAKCLDLLSVLVGLLVSCLVWHQLHISREMFVSLLDVQGGHTLSISAFLTFVSGVCVSFPAKKYDPVSSYHHPALAVMIYLVCVVSVSVFGFLVMSMGLYAKMNLVLVLLLLALILLLGRRLLQSLRVLVAERVKESFSAN
jgi:hypothetical protein